MSERTIVKIIHSRLDQSLTAYESLLLVDLHVVEVGFAAVASAFVCCIRNA